MSDIRVFASYSCDGDEQYLLCDGIHHHSLMAPIGLSIEASVVEDGACDGTCQMADLKSMLLAKIEKARGETIDIDEAILPSHVEISPEAQAIFDQDEVVGVCVDSWYCKRDGEGWVYCLKDGKHLRISTSFDWWSGRDTSRLQTMKVEVKACGQDRIHRVLTSDRVVKILTQARNN